MEVGGCGSITRDGVISKENVDSSHEASNFDLSFLAHFLSFLGVAWRGRLRYKNLSNERLFPGAIAAILCSC